MATTEELACVYSSLILQDDCSPVTAEKLNALLKSASVNVEPYWPGLFAKALDTINLKDLITNVGAGVGSAALEPAAAAELGAVEEKKEKKEEKKVEEEEEEDDDMGFGLFD